MVWNYFAIGHGKGKVDGTSVLLKQEFQKEQIKPNVHKLQCIKDVVKYLKKEAIRQHVAYPNARRNIYKYFWEVKTSDVDKNQLHECQTIDGSHKAHQVQSISHQDLTLIEHRDVSCQCPKCEDANLNFPSE